jgi:hypothetical protein
MSLQDAMAATWRKHNCYGDHHGDDTVLLGKVHRERIFALSVEDHGYRRRHGARRPPT